MQTAQAILRPPYRRAALEECGAIVPNLLWVFGAVELLGDPALQELLN